MTPDEQEAESHRYSNLAFFVLPLESGRIAILTPRRDLFKIVSGWDEALVEGAKAEGQRKTAFADYVMFEENQVNIDISKL
jgi:hypothetical protein